MQEKRLAVCFITNYLMHHQLPFCLEMEKQLGKGFVLIETETLPEERKKLGYRSLSNRYPFVINACESEEKKKEALELSAESEVAIIGSAPDSFIKERLRRNKLTFRCAERIFKQGRMDPLRWAKHTFKNLPYRNKKLYYLLNSAYAAKDFAMCGAKKEKMYSWGYFPECITYDIDDLLSTKRPNSLLWAGRLLPWKHPEAAVYVAQRLKADGYDFCLTIVGTGEIEEEIKKQVAQKRLEGYVKLTGAVPAEQVRSFMEKSEIFLFPSDQNEGWGAVVNEAMNSGCAVVACSAAGSVPCLVTDSVNGLVFESGNYEALYSRVKRLLDCKELKSRLGREAYHTITGVWNANTAALRLLELVEALGNGGGIPFEEGVASLAKYM